ncbi:MAG: DUF2341 domain-containing protein [Promethearchaeota archaeon]
MRIEKRKIGILTLVLISLIFTVFLSNHKDDSLDFNINTDVNFDDDFSHIQLSSPSWYNLTWKYRNVINITTGSAAVPSGYAVSLTFDHHSLVNMRKSRADGNDIRILYLNGSDWVEIDRILDSGSFWENESTKLWFKTQAAIVAFSYDSNYYLYYGNDLAGSPKNNSANIFLFHDDFENGNFNLWDGNNTETGDSINVSSDQVHIGSYAAKVQVDDVSLAQAMIWKDISGQTSLFAKIYIYLEPGFNTSNHVTVMQLVDISAGWQNLISTTIYQDMSLYMWNDYVDESYGYQATNNITTGTWHLLEMQATFSETAGEARLWMDGNLEVEQTLVNLSDSSSIRFCTGYYWGSPKNESNTFYIDNTHLRSYINPEPVLSLGTEEMFRPSINSFSYQKIITIDHTKVSGSSDLINFPLLISIYDIDLNESVQANGNDIAFHNGTDWLDHEIEYFDKNFNETHARLIAWVRIPSLSPTVDTNITMYYGNATMGSQENPSGVWDSNFVGVWHLNESGTGAVDEYIDSSQFGNHGQGGLGNSTYIPNQTTGSIGFGQDFSDHFIDCRNDTSLDITGNQITMQLWMKFPSTHPWMGPFNHKGFYDGYRFIMSQNSQYLRVQLPGNESDFQTSQTISTDTWHHVVATYNGSLIRIFIDGVPDAANLSKTSDIVSALPYPFRIGHGDQPEGKPWTYPWLGQIDEVRISTVGRSADWIATEYINQYNPNSFYTIESESQEDTTPPSITINSPTMNELFGSSSPTYDLTVIDANLDSIWYSLNGGSNSTPVSASGSINQLTWDALGNGTVTIRFYANDTLGNQNYKEVTVRKDILDPTITINSPNENDLFGSQAPNYNLSVADANLDSIWYTLNGGTTNSSAVPAIGTVDQTMWNDRPNGTVIIRFYVNDTVGNDNSTEVSIFKDIIEPSIIINSPNPNELFGSSAPDYNLTVTDANLDSIWYSLDGGTSNSTPVSPTGIIDQTMWNARPNGTIIITFYANDTLGNFNYSVRTVRKDVLAPNITIISPNEYDLFGLISPAVNLSVSDGNLDEIKYQLENASTTTSNYTWTGFIAQGVWDQIGNGTVTLRFYVNDTIGNSGSAEVYIYKDIYIPIISIISPNLNNVYNDTAPSFNVSISGSNLNTTWYNLNNGMINYTFIGLTGIINQSGWSALGDGSVTIKFYINNSLGVLGFDEIDVTKDTIAPQVTLNLPLNNSYCGTAPFINVLVTDANLDAIWYAVNASNIMLSNNVNQQIDASIWIGLPEGVFYVYIYANDSASTWSVPIVLRLYKDTIAPSVPLLISFPQGDVSGNLLFEWQEGSDPSGILKYRLIIDDEDNPFTTPGFIFETNITGNSYEFTGTLPAGTYYFFLYQIDGAGHQSPATTGSFSISSGASPTQPSEFPLWIIFVIIGAAVGGGVVGIVAVKKSKSKKEFIPQIPEKKPISKPVLEVSEELTLLDYDTIRVMSTDDINAREETLFEYIRYLEENNKYTDAAEFIGELILIENILGNSQEVELYRQKQIDTAVKGLEYLQSQYEIESKKAAVSGDYSKALEFYNESKLISENLKGYMKNQESSKTKEGTVVETIEPQALKDEVESVYSCINDLLTKYFDDVGIKYYSNPQIYDYIQNQIHGLILIDNKLQLVDIDPSIRDKIRSIQIIYTEDLSNENLTKLCQTFQNQYAILIIVGIKWPINIEAQTIEIPPGIGAEYNKNIRIIHCQLFATEIGLKDVYETAFKEIIDVYNRSEFDVLQETHESSEIIIHTTEELIYDLREKGLITNKLDEYFLR